MQFEMDCILKGFLLRTILLRNILYISIYCIFLNQRLQRRFSLPFIIDPDQKKIQNDIDILILFEYLRYTYK